MESPPSPHVASRARIVTDAREAELRELVETLKQTQARYRAALDSGFDAFVIVEAERGEDGSVTGLRVVEANARARAMADGPPHGTVGAPLLAAFPHSTTSGLWEQCLRVIATREPLETTQFAPLPDKPGRWVQRQLVPVGDGVAISSRDVTDRHRAGQELTASEERHRQLFESNGAVQLLVDADTGELVDVNPAAEAFYGWPRLAMRAMLITDIDAISLDDFRARQRTSAPGTGAHWRRVHTVASGERREVEAYEGLVEIDGRRAVHTIVQDVTERVRAEDALRESETRFRTVINGMRDGVVLHDSSGAIRVHNPSAERILGLTGEQLHGLQPFGVEWEAIHEDGTPWPPDTHPAMRALETGESQPTTLMGIRRGNGEHAWLHVTADPLLREGETRPHACIALFSDITELKGAEERLRRAQKLEAVGQLAGGIAHDFNNLLTVIRGATGFLREAAGSRSSMLDDIASIERATDRAEGLTRQLLAFGRRQTLRLEFTDIDTLLREYLVTLREALPVRYRLQHAPASERATTHLDRRRTLDALRVLVENAREAMPEGGTLTFETRVVERSAPGKGGAVVAPRRWVELAVRDSGSGMSEETRRHLFEPFYTSQQFGMSRGLGLPALHGLMAQSGGFVEVESMQGAGTTFRLHLPYADTPHRGATARPAERVVVGAPRGALLVEDDPMMRELGRRMLESLGHAVIVAESAPDALAVLDANAASITLVVTDLVLPGVSGAELIAAARRRHPGLAFVAITGHPVSEDARELIAAREIPLLVKPFTRDALAAAVGTAVSRLETRVQ